MEQQMAAIIRYPVFAFESDNKRNTAWDVVFLYSIQDALTSLEATDIANNEYICIDANGRLVEFEAISPERIALKSVETEPTHMKKLRQLLEHLLSYDMEQSEYQTLKTDDLIELVSEKWVIKSSEASFSFLRWIKKNVNKIAGKES